MTAGRTHFTKDCRARPSTPRTAVLLRLGRFALASLLTLPGTDLTAVPQGPAVRPGRLGTLLLADLIRMIKSVMALLPPAFICIDAVDECLPKNLPQLLESLKDIVRESPTTGVFLPGRPHVKEAIQRYFTRAAVIPIIPRTEDVRNYLRMRLDRDKDPEAMDDGLRADIMKIVLDRMSDMCVGAFALPCLSLMHTYGKFCIDSSSCR